MIRRVFFSFHYERDNFRANQVRQSWVTKPDREEAGYIDSADWEKLKRKGDKAIERWIDDQLKGASVTVVLIGEKTSSRKWVKYEIKKSHNKGKGILGVYIHNLKDSNGQTDKKGKNPFDLFYVEKDGKRIHLSEMYTTYNWKADDGYNNFGTWVEEAAKKAGR